MNEVTVTTLGAYLQHLRQAQGLPVRETARRVQCVPEYISMLESRQRRPSVGMLFRLVNTLSGDLNTALALLAQEEGVPLGEGVT